MALLGVYPPLVVGYEQGFDYQDDFIEITFKRSDYDSTVYDYDFIYLSVFDQRTGRSVVNTECKKEFEGEDRNYLLGNILIKRRLGFLDEKNKEFKVKIYKEEIKSTSIDNSYWDIRTYKINLSLAISDPSRQQITEIQDLDLNSILYVNSILKERQTDWCTAFYCKALIPPTVNMNILGGKSEEGSYITQSVNPKIIVNFNPSQDDQTEILKNYKFEIYNSNNILIEETDYLFYSDVEKKDIEYIIQKELDEGNYTVKFYYITINNYTNVDKINQKVELNFIVSNPITTVTYLPYTLKEENTSVMHYLNETFDATDEEDGCISVFFKLAEDEPISSPEPDSGEPPILPPESMGIKKFHLKRTDERSGFKDWVTVCTYDLIDLQNEIFRDITAESGILYRYGIQEEYEDEILSKICYDENIEKSYDDLTLRDFNYSYLIENNKILKFKYNSSINSINLVTNETKVDTLGSKYPYILRGGNTNYREFSLSGLISFNMEEETALPFFDNIYSDYEEKDNEIKDIIIRKHAEKLKNKMYDFPREKYFREQVAAFLNNGNPKLFKSATEGNMIIRLTNVNLQPKTELGRMIYTFSATVYEIDECNYENYLKYNFIKVEG